MRDGRLGARGRGCCLFEVLFQLLMKVQACFARLTAGGDGAGAMLRLMGAKGACSLGCCEIDRRVLWECCAVWGGCSADATNMQFGVLVPVVLGGAGDGRGRVFARLTAGC